MTAEQFLLQSLTPNWWNSKTGDTITLNKREIIYGITDNFIRRLAQKSA